MFETEKEKDDFITEICEGNIGALAFIGESFALSPIEAECGLKRMKTLGITGSKLYMLWNDCCERDTDLTNTVMNSFPANTIIHHVKHGHGMGIPIKKTITIKDLIHKIKFEYNHYQAMITNPTPDVTDHDKEKARIITAFLHDNFKDVLDAQLK